MHAIIKILPVGYILKGILSKFSVAKNLRYTVYGLHVGSAKYSKLVYRPELLHSQNLAVCNF